MTYESNSDTIHRKRQHRLWPLVAALWAAVGLSPCALAAVGDLDCLHCPTGEAVADHDGHGMHAMHGDPPQMDHEASVHGGAGGDCGDDCLDTDESLVDARSFKSSSKDAGDTLAVAAVMHGAIELVFAAVPGGVDPPLVAPVPRERLHAIHCVYLD